MAKPLASADFALFNEQLRQLLSSGFPLADGLRHFSAEIEKPAFRSAVERVAGRLAQGNSLSEALSAEGQPFSPEYIGLIQAGEESHDLLKMLDTALEHEGLIARLEKTLEWAVYYPLFVYGFSLLAFAAVMVWAYPVMARFYEATGHVMPLLFRTLHAVFYGPGGIFVVLWIAVLLLGFWRLKQTQGLGSLALAMPGLGRLMADVYSARLSRSLGLLLHSGVRVDRALASLASGTSDPGLKRRLLQSAHRTREGQSLSNALAAIGLAGTRFSDLVALGEETGLLPKLLTSGANMFQAEAESRLETVMRVTGAVLLVAAGLWVLILLSSWFQMYSLIPMMAT